MNTVRVYKFKVFDINNLDEPLSPKYATIEAIERINSVPVESSCIEVNESELDDNGYYELSALLL